MTETVTCLRCGGEGHLVCRHNIYTGVGDLYTVDCEDCSNTTSHEHESQENAIGQWNLENTK